MVDEGFKELAKENDYAFLQYAGIALIVIGSIVMIVGFFGCCGAIRESQCLLVMVSNIIFSLAKYKSLMAVKSC